MPADNNLHKAAHKGDLEECKKLIETPDDGDDPLDVNCPGASDRRPIHRAAGAGHMELCVYFLDKGAGINMPDNSGRTALHWAAISGNDKIVTLLISRGADIMAVTKTGMSALHGACEAGRKDVVAAIMTAVSPNPPTPESEAKKLELCNLKNAENKTAWDVAFGAKNTEVCKVLKDMGDPNGAGSSCTIS